MEIIICCSPIWGSLFYAILSLATFWREILYFLLHHIYLTRIVTWFYIKKCDKKIQENTVPRQKAQLFDGLSNKII